MAGFADRIQALSAFAKDKTAIVGLSTTGSFNVLAMTKVVIWKRNWLSDLSR